MEHLVYASLSLDNGEPCALRGLQLVGKTNGLIHVEK